MGYNDILTAIRELTPTERQSLLIEAALIDDPIVDHGLSSQEWREVKEAERKLDAGQSDGTPALPYLRALMAEKYNRAI